MTNEELVLLHRAGDRDALGQLLKQNEGALKKICLRLCRDNDIDDGMQEAAICLMDCVRLWDPNRGTKFITFLYHSVMTRVGRWVYRNRLVRYPYKKWQEANAVSVLSIYEDGKAIEIADVPRLQADEDDERRHDLARVKKVLSVFSERERKIVLRRAEGKVFREIAAEFGVTKQRAQQIYQHVRKQLHGVA